MLEEIDYEQINPGVRKLVKLLRDYGFDTCDSGDGQTHDFECDQEFPYVAIRIEECDFFYDVREIKYVLENNGVVFQTMDEFCSVPTIEATYTPMTEDCYVIVFNVLDSMLSN